MFARVMRGAACALSKRLGPASRIYQSGDASALESEGDLYLISRKQQVEPSLASRRAAISKLTSTLDKAPISMAMTPGDRMRLRISAAALVPDFVCSTIISVLYGNVVRIESRENCNNHVSQGYSSWSFRSQCTLPGLLLSVIPH